MHLRLRSALKPQSRETVLILAVSFSLLVIFQGVKPDRLFDDAYITFRYARNLSQGLGFVYNPGEPVLGTTTPLYTLILAVFARVIGPDRLPQISLLLALAADTINGLLMFRISHWVFKDRAVAAVLALLFLLHPYRLNVAVGGMETSLFITALLMAYDSYLVGQRSMRTVLWAALSVLLRPDAVIALAPIWVDWHLHDRRRALQGAVLGGLLVAPWFIWSLWYFGTLIPHSIIAKRAAYTNPGGYAAFFLLTFLGTGTIGPYTSLQYLAPAVLAGSGTLLFGLWKLARKRAAALVIVAYPLMYLALMGIINPAMYFSWYYLPLMPGLLVLLVAAVWFTLKMGREFRLVILVIFSVGLAILPAYLLQFNPGWPLSRAREAAFAEACRSINTGRHRGAWVMAPDIGVLGWCLAGLNILDPIGLVSPEAIAYQDGLLPGQLVSPRLVSDKKPDFVISLDQFINPYLFDDPFFQGAYQLVWSQDVQIVDTTQPIYVFQRNH